MNKTIIWLGRPEAEPLLPILQQKGYVVKFLDNIRQYADLANQIDCLIYYAPGAEIKVEDIPAGVSFVLYEPRSFTYYLTRHDARFALLIELAELATAVVCCDEVSRQWWSYFNVRTYLLGVNEKQATPSSQEVRIAEMIAADYLAGYSYAVKHRVGLWGKVKRYYKEFGLRQTLHRVYEKLSGQEDEN